MWNFTKQFATLLYALLLTPTIVSASSPAEQIQQTIQQVLTVVNATATGGEAARKQALRDSIMSRFDWPEMAKQALGRHWDGASARQDEFIAAFAEFLGSTYVGKIGSYKDEKIVLGQETVNNNLAEVKTKIVAANGESTSINYQLRQVQGEWKIYDVVVEDISLMVNYRAQFNRVLARGSFDDLLRQLREK
jgi:phospholipid transport system substrate-binding protein